MDCGYGVENTATTATERPQSLMGQGIDLVAVLKSTATATATTATRYYPITMKESEVFNMIHKIFYGVAPKFTEADCRDFSRGNYECKALMQDHRGAPVVISRSIDPAFRGWRVAYGLSCIFFNTYDEAMTFCKGRFSQ